MQKAVPLDLRMVREEVLTALGSARRSEADRHRRTAERIFRRAVRNMQREPDLHYEWSLLRNSSLGCDQEIEHAKARRRSAH